MQEDVGMTILETARLRLRRQLSADNEALIDLWLDPEVTRFMGGPRDRERLLTVFAESAADPFAETYDLWPVEELGSGRIVGHCGLLDKEVAGQDEIELVYLIAHAAWGQGYATEMAIALRDYAFHELGLARLIALIEPENAASERVAVKVGMHLEREILRPGGAMRRLYALNHEPR